MTSPRADGGLDSSPATASPTGARAAASEYESAIVPDKVAAGTALRVEGVSKAFGHVQALADVSLTVDRGEVVALVGDNGAGKSTLVKVISGVIQPDEGKVFVDGAEAIIRTPHDAADRGIRTIFQDLALCPNLSVVENLFLGREIGRGPRLFRRADFAGMRERTVDVLDGLGIGTIANVDVPVERLSGGQRQTVAVARATLSNCSILLLDEPTASLGFKEAHNVIELVHRLREQGTAILIITHNMRQVFEVADRIAVLHVGKLAATFRRSDTTQQTVVKAMMGKLGTNGGARDGQAPTQTAR